MEENKYNLVNNASLKINQIREELAEKLLNSTIPKNELLQNLGLYLNSQSLRRILFINELYSKIINTHGVIIEFGVRWGQNIALFNSLRDTYEPYNWRRKVIGFDTFEGFPSVDDKDGKSASIKLGGHGVTSNYAEQLERILYLHELQNSLPDLRKFELIKGDAPIMLEKYLKEHPETIIAFAYFDMDLYEPTKACLQLIKNHITKGTVIGFDELNVQEFPGETLALKETFGLQNIRITRSAISANQSYFILD